MEVQFTDQIEQLNRQFRLQKVRLASLLSVVSFFWGLAPIWH